MNKLEKFIAVLLRIDELIFRHWVVQIALICLWTYLLTYTRTWFNVWLYLGLSSYIIMHIRNAAQSEEYISELVTAAKTKKGALGLFLGLNYCMILGLLSFVLSFLLSKVEEKEDSLF